MSEEKEKQTVTDAYGISDERREVLLEECNPYNFSDVTQVVDKLYEITGDDENERKYFIAHMLGVWIETANDMATMMGMVKSAGSGNQ